MKTVLVTGGANGIGKAICQIFANNGYNIAVNYCKSKDKAENLVKELQKLKINAISIYGDVSNSNDVKNMIEKVSDYFGHIDIVVNNAGVCAINLLIDENDDTTQTIIQTNLVGTIETCKYAIKDMLKHNGGKIVNISSMWGKVGASCEATYSASKAGIIGLTKSLSKEYAPSGITVNCVCPGFIDTDMNNHLTSQEKNDFIEQIPMGRIGTPEEVANLVYFLTSDNANYITGQAITIDGGLI